MIAVQENGGEVHHLRITRFIRRDIPICPTHGVVMRAYSTHSRTTYYKCPEKDCKCTGKSIRREV